MKEIRISEIKAETRAEAAAAAEALILCGTAIQYDVPTVINDPAGSYTEIIHKGALDGCDMEDVRLLTNHDTNRLPLARTRAKTMQPTPTAAGLEFVATLPDTEEGRAAHLSVKRGDITGCSFAFTCGDNDSKYDPATNTRHIYRIQKLYECSLCTFPAYPTTSVEARNARAAAIAKKADIDKAKILLNKIMMKMR